MDQERGQLPDSDEWRIPEPDPNCDNCKRLAEFVQRALELLGEVREHLRRTDQEISEMGAETEKLRQMGTMLASEFDRISQRSPGGGIPTTSPLRPGRRRGTAARRKKSRKKRS